MVTLREGANWGEHHYAATEPEALAIQARLESDWRLKNAPPVVEINHAQAVRLNEALQLVYLAQAHANPTHAQVEPIAAAALPFLAEARQAIVNALEAMERAAPKRERKAWTPPDA